VKFFKVEYEGVRYVLYMGVDKMENEELLKYGWPEDVWFHVDELSSAHVYLRLPKGCTIETIPGDVVTDCAQLCKANSIEGNKLNDVKVVYTAWTNLKKTQGMDAGQVGFHDRKQVKSIIISKKDNTILNRIKKTRIDKPTEIMKEMREKRDQAERKKEKRRKQKLEEEKKEAAKKKKEEAELRSYSSVMKPENIENSEEMEEVSAAEYEENFF